MYNGKMLVDDQTLEAIGVIQQKVISILRMHIPSVASGVVRLTVNSDDTASAIQRKVSILITLVGIQFH